MYAPRRELEGSLAYSDKSDLKGKVALSMFKTLLHHNCPIIFNSSLLVFSETFYRNVTEQFSDYSNILL